MPYGMPMAMPAPTSGSAAPIAATTMPTYAMPMMAAPAPVSGSAAPVAPAQTYTYTMPVQTLPVQTYQMPVTTMTTVNETQVCLMFFNLIFRQEK